MKYAGAIPTPLRHAMCVVADTCRRHVFSLTRCTMFEVECGYDVPLPNPPKIDFRFGSRNDVRTFDLAHHEYGAAEREFGLERMDQEDSLVVGESNGEVVFYAWLMYGQIDLDQRVYIPCFQEIAYSYKVFTVESARGRHICAAYYSFIKKRLLEAGYSRLVCRIAPANTASIRAHVGTGFRPVGRLWTMVVPGCRLFAVDAEMRSWLQRSSASSDLSRRRVLVWHGT